MIMCNEILSKGSYSYTFESFKEVMDYINNKKINLSKIITHHFKSDDLQEAFAFANNPKNNTIKVVIDFK